jgi:hypothetical protein
MKHRGRAWFLARGREDAMVSPPAPDAEASPTCKDVSRPENLRLPRASASACSARRRLNLQLLPVAQQRLAADRGCCGIVADAELEQAGATSIAIF